jgi:Uncharacterized protein involved in copper resistance
MKKILVEVCCGSVDDALEAQAGNADRIELNSCLFLGGLTPTVGSIIETKKRLKIPIIVMIRPRGGSFCYSEAEMNVMEHDTVKAVEHGADGIVFGILNPDGTIDRQRSERIIRLVDNRADVVFHRAFDVTPDPFAALNQLIELGVKRVLTTGQKNNVMDGLDMIRELREMAKGRIEILPGGASPVTARRMIETTGCSQLHMASFVVRYDTSNSYNPQLFFGSALYPPEDRYEIIDRAAVSSVSCVVNPAD